MVTERQAGWSGRGLIFGLGLHAFGFQRDDFAAAFCLFAANIVTNRIDIVVEVRCVFLPISPYLFDNGITKHGYVSMSSWGVQIVGGSYPLLRQTASIRGRIAAVAMCLQFHVNK